MKQGLTHIIFVVDRSGSMSSIATDMIGGFNTFIKKQKEVPAECYVSFYQFDDIYETVFERVKLEDVKDLDDKTYVPRNMTALYDAMGKTINNYGKYLATLPEEERPERVLLVTVTDGVNNSSREFTIGQVSEMVKHQTEVYNWSFVFLGANIDAWSVGNSLGVAPTSTLQFANVSGSVTKAFNALSRNSQVYRMSATSEAYNFSSADLADQDQFLDEDLKSKNKKQQNKSSTTTRKNK